MLDENITEIVIGTHSIAEAIRSKGRKVFKIICTKEGLDELNKKNAIAKEDLKSIIVEEFSSHDFQSQAKREYEQRGFQFKRIPSQILALTDPVVIESPDWLYKRISSGKPLKIFSLDHVTDVHNGAAILRTAAFYGVDCLLIPTKGSFGLSPGFLRVASGAAEHVKIIKCSNLSRTLRKLIDQGVHVIGFSEHADTDFAEKSLADQDVCLVMGAEDRGLSNAVARIVDKNVSIKGHGALKSLNVSVAAAIAMEKFFGA